MLLLKKLYFVVVLLVLCLSGLLHTSYAQSVFAKSIKFKLGHNSFDLFPSSKLNIWEKITLIQPKLNFRIHSCYAEIEFTLSKKKFLVFELSEMNLFHSFSADVYFVKNKSQFQLTEKLMDFHILCTLEKNDSEDYTKSFALEIKRFRKARYMGPYILE
ncbi:hypothetical protein HMI54_003989 [Coelomomyces lativittatus]|nr:hypothetical protein HMI54_003989 [Coelomomyces lativittatus]